MSNISFNYSRVKYTINDVKMTFYLEQIIRYDDAKSELLKLLVVITTFN